MNIHVYYMNNTTGENLSDDMAGVTTLDRKHSGQKRVKRIIDVRVDDESGKISILCEELTAEVFDYAPPAVVAPAVDAADFF